MGDVHAGKMNHSYPNGERIGMKNILVGKIDAFPPGRIGEEAKDSDHPPHHGGNYALKPAKPNDRDIPKPGNGEGQVVYSADGVTYGHPKAAVVKAHQKRGWNKSFVTAAEWRAEREVEFPS